jgi:polysaccharide export outer membrane protein
MSYNIVMRGGDKVYIADPLDARVMVMGEVLVPKPVPLPSGSISLREALVAAGGIPFTGNRNCIQVIRGNLAKPKIYTLSWEQIVHLPNDSLLLMPGDTIYVSETPITQWNRFISQLLPSLSGVQSTHDILKAASFY